MVIKALVSTPVFGPNGLRPGSWQTCTGLGYHVPVFCTDTNLCNKNVTKVEIGAWKKKRVAMFTLEIIII